MPRFTLFFVFLFSFAIVSSQNAAAQQGTTAQPAPQDSQAVTVLNQALGLAGGAPAITVIQDYKASGTIIYPGSTSDLQGTVIVSGRGGNQVRMDSTLPTGVRSFVISSGLMARKSENGTIWKMPSPSELTNTNGFPYQVPIFPSGLFSPFLQLASALNNPNFSVFYKGVVQISGHSVHDIQVQLAGPPGTPPPAPFNLPTGNIPSGLSTGVNSLAEYTSIDYFVDVSTLQVLMIQNVIPRNIVHQVWYSDYRNVSGVLMPFAITEQAGPTKTWTIQLNQISFNNGLQDSDFAL